MVELGEAYQALPLKWYPLSRGKDKQGAATDVHFEERVASLDGSDECTVRFYE